MMESREVIIYSGNILNKAISLPSGNDVNNDDELFEGLKACVAQKQSELKDTSVPLNGNAVEVFAEDPPNDLHEKGERQDLKVTSKLFLYSLERKDIIAAVNRGLRCTSVDYMDNIILSFSRFNQVAAGPMCLDLIQKAWVVLEDQVHAGKVKMIGLSDVDPELFISFHKAAKVKPSIVQISLSSCCVVPEDLANYCLDNSVLLLTHKDPINVLPTDKIRVLGKLVNENCFVPSSPPANWVPNWVMRMQVYLRTRAVIATKGYVASLKTTTPSGGDIP